MCGIFGFCVPGNSPDLFTVKRIFSRLFTLSESRGKEASGMALCDGNSIQYMKAPLPATRLIKSSIFKSVLDNAFGNKNTLSAIGHSRLVTNGYEHENINNQPVVKNGLIVVHNGIITNCNTLWNKYPDEKRLSELDSELIPTLLKRSFAKKKSYQDSLRYLFNNIYGMTTFASLSIDNSNLLISTNNGSLYYIYKHEKNILMFASERYFLIEIARQFKISWLEKRDIKNLQPNNFILYNYIENSFTTDNFYSENSEHIYFCKTFSFKLNEINDKIFNTNKYVNQSLEHHEIDVPGIFQHEYQKRKQIIDKLKRCTKCILPETFPFINFDHQGVCNYCREHKPLQFHGTEKLKNLLSIYRSKMKYKHDCLVPFSGGRDSSYVLHLLKKELDMNPIAFSYDWGMLTDLGRRNQSRMCGALGVEHILVSADIRKKRDNIRKNVLAWLKRPRLGTIPLFMAGDKQYFYFINLLMKQNNLKLSVLGENLLETTKFKSGFCGIKPEYGIKNTYYLPYTNKLKMFLFYAKEYACNPSYINTSMIDTLDAFKSYYIIKHHNVNIFDYLKWEENQIVELLTNTYEWELDSETNTTWRIGDGTAAFYNYIYYMVAGFTENDTFRSNQIREGIIRRDYALNLVADENAPRFNSIFWYCKTINIDYISAIKIINKIQPLFTYEKN